MSPLTLLKWLLYVWTIFEFGNLSMLYWFAFKRMGRSKIMGGLAMLFTALTALSTYRFMTSYSIIITSQAHAFFRDFLTVPMFLVALTADIFRRRSIDTAPKVVEKQVIEEVV